MNQTIQDKDFLEDYDISQYDRPSIAADIAVFSIGRKTAEGSDYRRTDKAYLELCDVFSDSGRDPRGWILSQAFVAVLSEDDLANGYLEASGDASEARWFDITVRRTADRKE